MSTQEKINYEAHLKNLAISHSMLESAQMEGRLEGELKGELKGKEKNAKFITVNLINRGFPNEDIADLTGLSVEAVKAMRQSDN